MTGLIGFSSGYHAMLNCNTLVMLGTDFPYRQFYPSDACVIQIDRNPQALGRRVSLDLLKAVMSGRGGEVVEQAKTNCLKVKWFKR